MDKVTNAFDYCTVLECVVNLRFQISMFINKWNIRIDYKYI